MRDHPVGPSIHQPPSPQTAPEPPTQDSRGAGVISSSELTTVLIALDIAADDMRDRAELCADCPGPSIRPRRR
jgi:hypothetical protein